ncbi:MAG: prolyl oligopeptidase family serine peptidase [Caldimonas sp.]
MPRLALAALATAALLSACAPLPPAVPAAPATKPAPAARADEPGDTIAPNPNLLVQGIPPIPKGIADDVARYNDFRGHGFVDWHPTRREMLVAHRKAGASTTQIYRLTAPLGELEALTDFADPVRRASYDPIGGGAIVFERSSGGDEAAQIYRLDLATKQVTVVSEPDMRHDMQGWLHKTSRLLYLSVPLDRTATGGSRAEISQTLTLVDPAQPATRRKLAELPGAGWGVGGVSWDDRRLTLTRYLSASESQVWLLDIASGERTQLLPAPGSNEKATHFAGSWKHDDSGFFVVSDRGGEFRELMYYSLADRRLVSITRRVKGDVEGFDVSSDGRLLAVRANVEGATSLLFFDGDVFNELPSPALPNGSVTTAHFHPRLPLLAFALNSSKAPSEVGTIAPEDGASRPWTRPSAPPGVDTARVGEQQIVRWKSFDGREISGIVDLPPARFTGKRPVLIEIHGGPEGQSGFGFLGRSNYFVEELGVALIRPNVRGSSGFGKTFLSLDDGMKREDSVKDIGALLDWIAGQPRLDASRVLVSGGSYGGYMSLAVATRYADRIAGAIDVVGISNFVSFLQNTESYRRDLRRAEYGDERDPAMREFLTRISPLTNAAKITKPLFVVQGRNDPRVPYTEAEQIVAGARASGTRVWYLRAENEGHGFARKENADFQFYATVMFMRETLLK